MTKPIDNHIHMLELEIRRVKRLVKDPDKRARLIIELTGLIAQLKNLEKRESTKPTPAVATPEMTWEERQKKIIEETRGLRRQT